MTLTTVVGGAIEHQLIRSCGEELLTFLKVTLKVVQGVAPVLLL